MTVRVYPLNFQTWLSEILPTKITNNSQSEECRKNWFLHNLQVASARKGNRIRPPSKHLCGKMQGGQPDALKIAAALALCEQTRDQDHGRVALQPDVCGRAAHQFGQLVADALGLHLLTDKLERSFKILKGEGRITEINVAETLKEIRRALIDADVNYKVAKSFDFE